MLLALDEFARQKARYHFRLDRDETDSYSTALVKCTEGSLDSPEITEADLLCLLPSGSNWRHAVGQRSLYGMKVKIRAVSYVIIGKEEILPHPTRGAFPVVDAYLFEDLWEAAECLLAMQGELPSPLVGCFSMPYGIIQASSVTPDEHGAVEAAIVAQASRRWSEGASYLFRTLILSDGPFRIVGHPHPLFFKQKSALTIPDSRQPYLMAVTPNCLATLPSPIKKWATSGRRKA